MQSLVPAYMLFDECFLLTHICLEVLLQLLAQSLFRGGLQQQDRQIHKTSHPVQLASSSCMKTGTITVGVALRGLCSVQGRCG